MSALKITISALLGLLGLEALVMLYGQTVQAKWGLIALWAASPLLWLVLARRRARTAAPGAPKTEATPWLAGFLLVLAGFGTTILLLLAWMSWGQKAAPFYLMVEPQRAESNEHSTMVTAGVLCFLIATPLNLAGLAWTLGIRRPRWGALALLGLAPVFVYLARDDASSPYLDAWKEFSTLTPTGKAGYDVVMRWHADGSYSKAFEPPPVLVQLKAKPGSSEWLKAIAENRGRFDSAWTELEPIRTWWAEWAAMPEIGDHVTGVLPPVASFKLMGTYARLVQVRAAQLAQEGRGDEAIELLLPLIEGAQKLETSGLSLSRLMSSRVLLGIGMDAVENVLNLTSVTESSRKRLATLLASGTGGAPGARRVVGVEFNVYITQLIHKHMNTEPFTGGLLGTWLGPVLLNPLRTLNQIGGAMQEVGERAARRDPAGAQATVERLMSDTLENRGIKNILGDNLVLLSTLDPAKIIERYWLREDQRAALINRLRGPDAGETKP